MRKAKTVKSEVDEVRKEYCVWNRDDNGIWHTRCGRMPAPGTELQDGMKFCAYCGKELKQA